MARAAGVSRATVSRVINGIRNVDLAIQEKVKQAIALTGYVPNQAARSLVTRRTGTIALIVSGAGSSEESPFPGHVFADPFFGRVAGGVVGFLRPLGIYPILMFADTPETRDQVITYLRRGNVDGAILVSISTEDTLPKLLADASLPAVLFARPARPIPISYVDVGHRSGASWPPTISSPGAAAGWRPSPARSTSRPARTAWRASRRRWPSTAIPTSPAPRATSPSPVARWRWNGCSPSTPTSTASSRPTT